MLQNKLKPIIILRRYHFTIAVIIIMFILLLEGIFLYRYFYRALTESKVLIELKQSTAMEQLNLPAYERLMKFYVNKQKTPPTNWEALRDPFTPITPTTNSSP